MCVLPFNKASKHDNCLRSSSVGCSRDSLRFYLSASASSSSPLFWPVTSLACHQHRPHTSKSFQKPAHPTTAQHPHRRKVSRAVLIFSPNVHPIRTTPIAPRSSTPRCKNSAAHCRRSRCRLPPSSKRPFHSVQRVVPSFRRVGRLSVDAIPVRGRALRKSSSLRASLLVFR